MFDNLKYDPNAKKKVAFFVFSGVLILSIISLLIYVNFSGGDSGANQTPVEQDVDFKDDTQTVVVTDKSFEDAADLELVDPEIVNISDQILFLPGNQIGFLNQSYNLRINTQNIPDSPAFLPSQMYYTNDGIIINESFRSTIYQNNGKFLPLASGISNVTPFSKEGKQVYLYLDSENKTNNYKIKQANSILLSANPPVISEFLPDKSYEIVEMKILQETPYIFGYNNFAKTGDIDIWQVTNSGTRKVKSLQKVISTKQIKDQFIYTNELDIPNEITPYKTNLINFTNPNNISEKEIAVTTKLAQNNVFGNLLAQRCGLENDGSLLCLVKQQKSVYTNTAVRDLLVKIDPQTNSIGFPNPNLVFSASDIHISDTGEVYVVSQSTSQLYKLRR